MKWFHHDCAASSDPKLRFLGTAHGLEGIGLYWVLLEEIGQCSDTFHLKLIGSSRECDRNFMDLVTKCESSRRKSFGSHVDLARIPQHHVRTLAEHHFTTTKKLMAVIRTSVKVGLFDSWKWQQYNVLYSSSFEQRADDYTRKRQRRDQSVRTLSGQTPDNVRILSGQTPDTVRILSRKVRLETEAETEVDVQKQKKLRRSMLKRRQEEEGELSTNSPHLPLKEQPYLIELSDEGLLECFHAVLSEISSWNDGRSNKFDWTPTEAELRKLFLGGSDDHKLSLCRNAFTVLDERINYPELVLRALRLMLRSSENKRITNPFGWMWSCLHGNGDGTLPWVQLLTAQEEDSLALKLRMRIRDNHPP